jgi:hypothetical protein
MGRGKQINHIVKKPWVQTSQLILTIFLIGCDSYYPEVIDNTCHPNTEIQQIHEDNVCIDSIKCGKVISSYSCFCDGACICFVSKLYNCNSIYDTCEHDGAMLIVGGKICRSEEGREYLFKLFEEIE